LLAFDLPEAPKELHEIVRPSCNTNYMIAPCQDLLINNIKWNKYVAREFRHSPCVPRATSTKVPNLLSGLQTLFWLAPHHTHLLYTPMSASEAASSEETSGVAHVFFLNDFSIPIACDLYADNDDTIEPN